MWAALLLVIVVSFLTYVLCFGASSSGVIGQLNHFLTASVGGCVRAVLGKCFGKRWRSVLKVTWLTARCPCAHPQLQRSPAGSGPLTL